MRSPNPLGLHPDEFLVALSIGGATGAFEELIRRHNGPLRRFLSRLVRNHSDAEELAQEAFIKAWQNLSKWQKTASFRSWLFSIGLNCFQDALRKAKSRAAREKSWFDLNEVNHNSASLIEQKHELEQILRHFPPQQSAILELFYGEGFSHGEIADIMQLPLGSVKSQISRARAQIAALMTDKTIERNHNHE